jgi:5-methyltetrahydrofolate--homocysteine methyltransferase
MNELTDEELLERMADDLYDGLTEEVAEATHEALSRGMTPQRILNDGLIAGMSVVGDDFRDGVLFVPEVMMAAKAMKAALAILEPLLTEANAQRLGTLVIGTVKGDIHDIGKNLVAMMMEGAGFEVINLGINTDAAKFISAVKEHDADLLGMSALLTTTMPYMRTVIEALEAEGLRSEVKVLVGGAPVNEAWAEQIGAEAYGTDAAAAVEIAKKFMAIKRGR